MGETLAALVIDRHRLRLGSRCRVVIVDLDSSHDPTHGAQQLSFFHGHYDTWCYGPLLGFLSFDDEREQHLFTAILRAGNANDKRGVPGVLRRLLPQLRQAFPNARRLSRLTEQTEHVYGECRYAASTWSHQRRVIIKAEVVRHPEREPKDNPRFVITNLRQSPRWIYEQVYGDRGNVENRIKELKHGLEIDRTSCPRFLANQFRVFLAAAAYILMQVLREHAQTTGCAQAQVTTLRERLLKLGVQVIASTRRPRVGANSLL
jgi:hypothetical protein